METRNHSERKHYEELLKRKIEGIPQGHLPNITLADIVSQSPKVTCLNSIPSDLQLDYFFANHTRIARNGSLAAKDYLDQSLRVTRAIFYYRIDQAHQFARYHDSPRWNLAFFCALLCQHEKTSSGTTQRSKYSMGLRQEQFAVAYLEAVLEYHANESVFVKRDSFVKMWKDTEFDFFSLGAAQRKRMKKEMKRLSPEFERELDSMKHKMGSEQYEQHVARFVGSLVPGRVDQRAENIRKLYAVIQLQEMQSNGGDVQDTHEDNAVNIGSGEGENKLLEALKVPLEPQDWETHMNKDSSKNDRLNNVVEIGVAFDAVRITTAKEIMDMLLLRFN